jgi:hypothetical protein
VHDLKHSQAELYLYTRARMSFWVEKVVGPTAEPQGTSLFGGTSPCKRPEPTTSHRLPLLQDGPENVYSPGGSLTGLLCGV